jgi:hypothetical protein
MVGLLKLELRAQQAALGRLLSAWAETNHIANPVCGESHRQVFVFLVQCPALREQQGAPLFLTKTIYLQEYALIKTQHMTRMEPAGRTLGWLWMYSCWRPT